MKLDASHGTPSYASPEVASCARVPPLRYFEKASRQVARWRPRCCMVCCPVYLGVPWNPRLSSSRHFKKRRRNMRQRVTGKAFAALYDGENSVIGPWTGAAFASTLSPHPFTVDAREPNQGK